MAKRQAFPPGEYLADELNARGWSQADLAKILDRPFQHVNLLINGKRRMNAEIASELAAAFGTSAEVWLNLQAAWDAYNAPTPARAIARRAEAMASGPTGTRRN
jgi:HTH-type transcriptional regulator/antitoxin HigA